MGEENIDLVRRLCRMISNRDPRYLDLYDPNVEFREAGDLPDAGVQRGIPAPFPALGAAGLTRPQDPRSGT
jgi:hypothetical protein